MAMVKVLDQSTCFIHLADQKEKDEKKKKWKQANNINKQYGEKEIKMPSKCMKRYSTP